MSSQPTQNQRIAALLIAQLELSQRPRMRAPARTVLASPNEFGDKVYVLHTGAARVELYPDSNEGSRVIPVHFVPGMVMLVHQVYDARPDPGLLVAHQDSELYTVSHEEFRQVMHANMERMQLVAAFLASRLHDARMREQQWLERSVERRVSAALSRLAWLDADSAFGPIRIAATHEMIAEHSGVSRAKVSRELKRLESAGHIRLGRNRIDILNLPALSGR